MEKSLPQFLFISDPQYSGAQRAQHSSLIQVLREPFSVTQEKACTLPAPSAALPSSQHLCSQHPTSPSNPSPIFPSLGTLIPLPWGEGAPWAGNTEESIDRGRVPCQGTGIPGILASSAGMDPWGDGQPCSHCSFHGTSAPHSSASEDPSMPADQFHPCWLLFFHPFHLLPLLIHLSHQFQASWGDPDPQLKIPRASVLQLPVSGRCERNRNLMVPCKACPPLQLPAAGIASSLLPRTTEHTCKTSPILKCCCFGET